MTKKQWKSLSFGIVSALLILILLVNFTYSPNALLAQEKTTIRISELDDVRPTDWNFTALQSLSERYGIALNYRDKSFRGNRPITRGEEAVWIKKCLDKLGEILNQSSQSKASDQELNELNQLIIQTSQEIASIKLKQLNNK